MSSKTKRYALSMIMAAICFIAAPISGFTVHSMLDDMINIIGFQTEMSYMQNGVILGPAEAIAQMETVQWVSIAAHVIFLVVFVITFVLNFKRFKDGRRNELEPSNVDDGEETPSTPPKRSKSKSRNLTDNIPGDDVPEADKRTSKHSKKAVEQEDAE